MYTKLKRLWSNRYGNHIPKFKEIFPELKNVSREEMRDRWIKLDVYFYTYEIAPVKTWVRFTLPFALILMLLMYIGLPFHFLITGKWAYPLGEKKKQNFKLV